MASPTRARRLAAPLVFSLSVAVAVTMLPSAAHADPSRSIAEVQAQVEALEHKAEIANEAYLDARGKADEAERTLAGLNDQIAAREAELAKLKASVGGFAATAYRGGGLDNTMQLLLADDPARFLSQASALDGVARHQGEVLRRVGVAKQQLSNDKIAAAAQQESLAALEQQMAANKKAVDGSLAETERVLNTLKEEERQRLEAERKRQAEIAAQKAREASARIAAQRAAAAEAARVAAASRPSRDQSRPAAAAPSAGSGRAAQAVSFAMAQVGKRYVYGATGLNSYDCSGLTMRAWGAAGVGLPHSSRAQYGSGTRVGRGDLQPGDLVFYYSPISHVGIYVGGGMIVHAANPSTGVRMAPGRLDVVLGRGPAVALSQAVPGAPPVAGAPLAFAHVALGSPDSPPTLGG